MTYTTLNGETRTTISVRLTSQELDALDDFRERIRSVYQDNYNQAGHSSWTASRPTRSEALRQALAQVSHQ